MNAKKLNYFPANAINCFQCNSVNDTGCDYKENIPNNYNKPCPERNVATGKLYSLCRKIDQTVEYEVNGRNYHPNIILVYSIKLILIRNAFKSVSADKRTIRSCGYLDYAYENKCLTRSGYGGTQIVCSCSGDGCNSSTSLTATTILVSALVLMRLLTKKLLLI